MKKSHSISGHKMGAGPGKVFGKNPTSHMKTVAAHEYGPGMFEYTRASKNRGHGMHQGYYKKGASKSV